MSEIFPSGYAWLFIGQIIILLVVYIILRSRTSLKLLKSLCLSVLVVTALTLLLLVFRLERYIHLYRADLEEYVTGTFVVAIPFLLILIIQFLVPFLKEIGKASKAAGPGPERARILQMVEDGKVTSEEGSELLEAMGKSSALRGQDKFTLLDMAILTGVALVILGFFLPWVYIRISRLSGMPGIQDLFDKSAAYQTGYHTGVLGWTIFITALVSVLPVFITPKNFLYKISILHLFLSLLGLLLVLITLFRAGSNFGIGIIACTVGFTIELIASGAKFKQLAA